MIKDKWWMAAIDIKNGDLIETSKGIYEKVIEVEILENIYPVNVYNLKVEDNHNYFVGKDEVLTRNITTKKMSKIWRVFKRYYRRFFKRYDRSTCASHII